LISLIPNKRDVGEHNKMSWPFQKGRLEQEHEKDCLLTILKKRVGRRKLK